MNRNVKLRGSNRTWHVRFRESVSKWHVHETKWSSTTIAQWVQDLKIFAAVSLSDILHTDGEAGSSTLSICLDQDLSSSSTLSVHINTFADAACVCQN